MSAGAFFIGVLIVVAMLVYMLFFF